LGLPGSIDLLVLPGFGGDRFEIRGAGIAFSEDGAILKNTPGLNADSTLICSILGGNPA